MRKNRAEESAVGTVISLTLPSPRMFVREDQFGVTSELQVRIRLVRPVTDWKLNVRCVEEEELMLKAVGAEDSTVKFSILTIRRDR